MFQRSKNFALFRGSDLRLVSTRRKGSFERSAKGSILNFGSASCPETFYVLAPAQASPDRWVRHGVRAQRGDLTWAHIYRVLSQCATLIRRSGASLATTRLLVGGKVKARIATVVSWAWAARDLRGTTRGEYLSRSSVPFLDTQCQCANAAEAWTGTRGDHVERARSSID